MENKIIIDGYFDYLVFTWLIMFFIWALISLLDFDLKLLDKLKILFITTLVVIFAVSGVYLIDSVLIIK